MHSFRLTGAPVGPDPLAGGGDAGIAVSGTGAEAIARFAPAL